MKPSPSYAKSEANGEPEDTPTGASPPFGLTHDNWGRLVLIDADGRRHVGVEPVRSFPISDPGRWISLCDSHGREILCVESLERLSPGVRQILEDELAHREFVPVITRIVRVSGETSPSEWVVETDRGPTTFTLENEDDIRRLEGRSVLITDAQKLRYRVPDTGELDHASRRLLERYL
ncbi:cyanophycin metabolism-associated DUF1854 family protein [Singulisphaera rosea]